MVVMHTVGETTILNRYTDPSEPGDVYIGRPSRWGNPFPITGSRSREEAVEEYRRWLWQRIRTGRVPLADLAELHGRGRVCFCSPRPCHGDVLAKAAAWAGTRLAENEP